MYLAVIDILFKYKYYYITFYNYLVAYNALFLETIEMIVYIIFIYFQLFR